MKVPFAAARAALRTYWRSAGLIVLAGAVALAAAVPVVRLAAAMNLDTRLRFTTVRVSDLGFHWGSNASTPAMAQGETVQLLFQMLLIAAFATLILAAIGILSISAARGSARFPEIAIRRAVGASRRHLLQAAVLEGGLMGTAALVVGLFAGALGLLSALAGWPGRVAPGSPAPGMVAVLFVSGTIMIGALFQLLSTPSRRIAEPNPHPLALYIPAMQLGMGLTVLAASTMLVRHAEGLLDTSVPMAEDGQIFEFSGPELSPRARSEQYRALLAQLDHEPRVESASIMSPGAVVGLGMADAITTDCGYCPDGGVIIKWHAVFATHHFVTADTFGALGLGPVEGRLLTDDDRWSAPPVAVISRSLARRHFEGGQAIGRQILLKLEKSDWYTVVGVVPDREPTGFGGEAQPRATIYLSALQHPPSTVDLLVRAATASIEPGIIHQAIARHVAAATPFRMVSEQETVAREAAPLAWFGRWFSLLGWAMLVITAASTFVLMRLYVLSLLPELGLHRTVGARRSHLFRYILSRAGLAGFAGLGIALWFGPALWNSLPELVTGLPAWSLAQVLPQGLLLFAISLAGALMPALRAARSTPSSLLASIGE